MQNVSWPPIGGTSYPVPSSPGETNWPELTNYLVALGQAQGTKAQKVAVRIATSSPVTFNAANDCVVGINLSIPAATTVNLPAGVAGQTIYIIDKRGDAATNNITIVPNGSQQINGAADYTVSVNGGAVILCYDGLGNWLVAAKISAAGSIAPGDLPSGIDASKLADGSVSNTEFQYINSVTSNVQTQLDSKIPATEKGSANGVATLGSDGLIPSSQLPPVAITDTFVVANQAAQTGLAAEVGDVCVRTDQTKTYILRTLPASTFSNWTELATPTAPVLSVNGQTGSVVLTKSDVSLGNVDNTTDAAKPVSTAQATAISTAVSTHAALTATHGVSGAIVGTTDTQALTNKDYDGGTASNANRMTIPKGSSSTLQGLARKQGTLAFDTTLLKAVIDDGTAFKALGSGVGGKNYNSNPDDANANWTASAGGIAVSTETSTANLPENATKTTAIKILRASGSDYVRLRFTLDVVDYGRMLPIQWLQKYAGTAGDYTLEVYSNTASDYSGSYTNLNARISSIPSGNGLFMTDFVASGASAPYIEVRVKGNAGTTALYLSGVKVGDYTLGTQAPITTPQAWTPDSGITQGLGTIPSGNNALHWRQVGTNMLIGGRFQVGPAGSPPSAVEARLALPSGYTVGTFGGKSVTAAVGNWSRNNVSASAVKHGVVLVTTGSNYIGFSVTEFSSTTNPGSLQSGSSLFNADNVVYFDGEISIPIAEWAGQTITTNGQGNGVEYASNSDTTNANASVSSTVYGPEGSALPTTLTALRTKTIRFQIPIQADDILVLEIKDSTNGNFWVPVNGGGNSGGTSLAFEQQNTNTYGMSLRPNVANSTDVAVQFGIYAVATGATYGATGTDWGSVSNVRWRVRKVKATSPAGILKANSVDTGLVAPRKGQTSLMVTSTQAGWVQTRAVGIYYQDQDGNHRLKFNLDGSHTTATVTSLTLTIAGVTFKNASSVQACAGFYRGTGAVVPRVFANPNTSNINVDSASATGTSGMMVSGDVELDSKPSWA